MAGWIEGEPGESGFYWVQFDDGWMNLILPVTVGVVGGQVRHQRFGQEGWQTRKIARWAEMASPPRRDARCPSPAPGAADAKDVVYPGMVRLEAIEGRVSILETGASGAVRIWESVRERLDVLEGKASRDAACLATHRALIDALVEKVAALESHRDWAMRAAEGRNKRYEGWGTRIATLEAKLNAARAALQDEPEPEQEDE